MRQPPGHYIPPQLRTMYFIHGFDRVLFLPTYRRTMLARLQVDPKNIAMPKMPKPKKPAIVRLKPELVYKGPLSDQTPGPMKKLDVGHDASLQTCQTNQQRLKDPIGPIAYPIGTPVRSYLRSHRGKPETRGTPWKGSWKVQCTTSAGRCSGC